MTELDEEALYDADFAFWAEPGGNSDGVRAAIRAYLDHMNVAKQAERIKALERKIERMDAALAGLLNRDEINTCTHENTHRGGFLWEICDECGAKWADDEGGKPEWVDPPEWIAARAARKEPT